MVMVVVDLIVVVQLWEQFVQDAALSRHAQSLLLAIKLAAKVAPAATLSERLEHLSCGAGSRTRPEEGKVLTRAANGLPVTIIHVHVVIEIRCESRVLGTGRNLLIVRRQIHASRWMRMRVCVRVHLHTTHAHVDSRIGSVLLKTVSEVVEVCVKCKVVGRYGTAESAAVVVEEKTGVGSAGRAATVFTQGRGDREGFHVVEIELEVHVEVRSKVR